MKKSKEIKEKGRNIFKLFKNMEAIALILFIALWGYWCYKIAENNGRDKIMALILGAMFGILSVMGYYIYSWKITRAKKTRIN